MTDRQVLLKRQKNQLFKIIEEAGLNPGSFEWTDERVEDDETDRVISRLSYKDSMYFYRFDVTTTRYVCRKCPGFQKTTGLARFAGWSAVVADFAQWAKRLKAEIDTPDLWAATLGYQSIFTLPHESGTKGVPFSHEEAEQMAARFERLQDKITEQFQLTDQQLEFVRAKMTYLESKAKEGFFRHDWMHLLIGVVSAIAVKLALSEKQARRFWELVKDSLSAFGGFT